MKDWERRNKRGASKPAPKRGWPVTVPPTDPRVAKPPPPKQQGRGWLST